MRTCAKPRCRARASVTVVVRYGDREVALGELSQPADPSLLDLCLEHARRLTAPLGWTIVRSKVPEPV